MQGSCRSSHASSLPIQTGVLTLVAALRSAGEPWAGLSRPTPAEAMALKLPPEVGLRVAAPPNTSGRATGRRAASRRARIALLAYVSVSCMLMSWGLRCLWMHGGAQGSLRCAGAAASAGTLLRAVHCSEQDVCRAQALLQPPRGGGHLGWQPAAPHPTKAGAAAGLLEGKPGPGGGAQAAAAHAPDRGSSSTATGPLPPAPAFGTGHQSDLVVAHDLRAALEDIYVLHQVRCCCVVSPRMRCAMEGALPSCRKSA